MKALIYLYRTSFINRVKKALHKPVTYIYLVLGILYVVMMAFSFSTAFETWNLASPEGLVAILSGMTCVFLPSNIVTYAKRKGLLYRPWDVHFIFTAPFSPKTVLLYAQLKQLVMGFIISLFLTAAGIFFFEIPLWKMLLYFFMSFIVENLLETNMMILLYGNERLSEKTMKWLCRSLYLIIGFFVAIGVFLYFDMKSMAFVGAFLEHPLLQCVPLIGWNIAFIRLLLLGPTVVNVTCTLLYCLTAVVFLILAIRMKCTGEYYEDAMKFADDYQEARKRQKKGEMVKVGGKKQKFRAASVRYKGRYGKAIFYRQLLEYKKNRFFVFGWNTLLCLILGVGVAYLLKMETDIPMEIKKYFIIPIVAAYITFLFSGYITKWEKELDNPYTYLIPDRPFKKLWYSTAIEHFRALVDGCLLVLPAAIVIGIPPGYVVLDIFIYICLQANKLYFSVLSLAVLGNVLGNTGRSILRMTGQMFVIGIAVLIAIVVSGIWNIALGYLAMCLYMAGLTILVSLGGSVAFSKMEAL